jgi:hypothetical protein
MDLNYILAIWAVNNAIEKAVINSCKLCFFFDQCDTCRLWSWEISKRDYIIGSYFKEEKSNV